VLSRGAHALPHVSIKFGIIMLRMREKRDKSKVEKREGGIKKRIDREGEKETRGNMR